MKKVIYQIFLLFIAVLMMTDFHPTYAQDISHVGITFGKKLDDNNVIHKDKDNKEVSSISNSGKYKLPKTGVNETEAKISVVAGLAMCVVSIGYVLKKRKQP